MYEMREESGRMGVHLRALQLAEQDMADYGAIERTDHELEGRARCHVAQMQAQLPTLQARLSDDVEALTTMIVEQYAIAYRGLLVAYTGLKEPFCLPLDPRYTTSAAFDDSGVEHDFVGLSGLRAIIREDRRPSARTRKSTDVAPRSIQLFSKMYTNVYILKLRSILWQSFTPKTPLNKGRLGVIKRLT